MHCPLHSSSPVLSAQHKNRCKSQTACATALQLSNAPPCINSDCVGQQLVTALLAALVGATAACFVAVATALMKLTHVIHAVGIGTPTLLCCIASACRVAPGAYSPLEGRRGAVGGPTLSCVLDTIVAIASSGGHAQAHCNSHVGLGGKQGHRTSTVYLVSIAATVPWPC
jgi:hypothetical protein